MSVKAVPTFKRTPKGAIIADDQDNIRAAIKASGMILSYDQLKEVALMNGEPLADHHVEVLWLYIDRTFKFRPSKELFYAVVNVIARGNSFHPVLDHLKGLEWDGVPRIDCWLMTYFGAQDTPFNRAVSAITLIAAVRRIKNPGTKFDELPILESAQGKGKSTGLRYLAGDDDWFTDNLALNSNSKMVIEQTSGFWIVEVPDLDGLKKADWDKLKALLSRQVDVARLAYGRLTERRPRQFVAIGTTNSLDYLTDPTGNRRFWPIRLSDDPVDLKGILRDRDQLWAEAVVREAKGESIRLPSALWKDAAQEQEARTKDDPWRAAIEEALDDREGRILTETLWQIVGLDDIARRNYTHVTRLQSVMHSLGWKKGSDRGRIEVGGKRYQGWTKGERPAIGTALPLIQLSAGWNPGDVVTVVTPGSQVVDSTEVTTITTITTEV